MKKSSLNANAASYVPVSKRNVAGEGHEHPLTAKGSESRNGSVQFGTHSVDTTVDYHLSKPSQNYRDYKNPASETYSWKHANSHGSYASSSKSVEVSQDLSNEDIEMDLLYLQMNFPGLSEDSLSHIYMVNSGNLESTVDMLSQLELCANDSSDLLPDTLEIGDTSDTPSKERASLKLKEVTPEIAGSSVSSIRNLKPVQN